LPQTQVDLVAEAVLGQLLQVLWVLEILEAILPLKDIQVQRLESTVVTREVKLAVAAVAPAQLVDHHLFDPAAIGMLDLVELEFYPR
jgi:hypothetical protein